MISGNSAFASVGQNFARSLVKNELLLNFVQLLFFLELNFTYVTPPSSRDLGSLKGHRWLNDQVGIDVFFYVHPFDPAGLSAHSTLTHSECPAYKCMYFIN